MPDRSRVDAFVATVVSGDHVKAITDFYHENASMQEPGKEPRRGRELLEKHEQAALNRLERMYTHPASAVLIDGDNVVINGIFDATTKDGVTRCLEELAIQRWQGDRIIEERFFYDTASAWTIVEA
ncbi:SnoaL-like domain-containing protein [Phyllobacterium sp. 628]|uniref:nuclear transport factor 2 family protein n=1 Tax=Phyllobacterium sp. 628 TaxID=2718938 RepID=UPI00166261C7|nr:nuclear transport factor 2 family protein [Phyllobacterium sp. 628]QND52954.1 SnoaL-like domain-containing protein [Phyllobacterium sp. 628]